MLSCTTTIWGESSKCDVALVDLNNALYAVVRTPLGIDFTGIEPIEFTYYAKDNSASFQANAIPYKWTALCRLHQGSTTSRLVAQVLLARYIH
jgi:predicted ATP-grasp superfamily ATP-dependent carboligase